MTKEETEYVYSSVKNGTQVKPVHIDKTVDRSVDVSVNPYKEALTQEVDGHLHDESSLEMKKCDLAWSILSTMIDYTTIRNNSPYVEMNTSNLYNKLQEDEQLISGDSSDQWDERFEEVTCSLHYSHKFDDTNDVSTTYLGSYMAKDEPRTFPVDNHIPFDGRGMSKAYLSNGTPMKLFFDSGASRSYLSKRFYDSNPVLHDMPKFVTTCTGIRIGNGSIVPALFVIPILFMTCGHTFEIFTIVAKIDDDMDLVFGFKNMVETEGMLNTRTGEYDFNGKSIPVFPKNDLDVPVGEKAYIKVKAPFCDKLSGMICTKFFGRDMVYTLRMKFQDNQGVVQFKNGSDEIAQLRKDKAVGILDLRSIGYFKVGYQKMVNMAESSKTFKMYHYKQIKSEAKTEDWLTSDQYLRVTGRYGNERSKEIQENKKQNEIGRRLDPYPWLAEDDPRRHQTDEEILYEKVDLSNSVLSRKEKTRLMKMLIKYRNAFSLRDEIGECPNLEADIKVIDDSPFFVRPFPISENDKPFMDDQMERLVSLGILSKNSTSHTSPVMLITRKLTKDKRPVVDFSLLNTRILRRNTSIPLMSDVLSILGNSECEVVSCVDIKDAYHSIRLTEKSKEYCGILPYFGSPIYRYEILPMGIACAPQIWMDYITLILSELEDKKKYIAIMDDLLIHSTRVDHWILLEQLLKFHPPPIEGIDTGGADGLETLDPEIRIPIEEDFVLPPPLESLLDKAKMAYKFLPKQGDIDRLIAKINKKVLRDTTLCVDLRDLKAAYLTSPDFRDIYLYLLQNRMPLGKGAAKRLDQIARNYLILDGLLFKVLDDGEGNLDTVLCIPTSKVHILLNAYHSSLLEGHTGITKCYHTISQRFYCPNLAENLRAYKTGCHVCQLFKKGKDFKRPYQKRINLNVPAMTKISIDLKQMLINKGYSHMLLCEVTNYMVALPLMSTRTPHILDAFQKGYLAYLGPPTHIVCDQDPAFTSSLMEVFVRVVGKTPVYSLELAFSVALHYVML